MLFLTDFGKFRMNVRPQKPPSPLSMETLHPDEAKFYRPGSSAGKRPRLVWERLWTTANGEYGDKYYLAARRAANMGSENTQEKPGTAPSELRSASEDENTGSAVVEASLRQSTGKSKDLPHQPDQLFTDTDETTPDYIYESVTARDFQDPNPALAAANLPPNQAHSQGAAMDRELAMSNLSRAYLQHRVGRYWEDSRTTHLQC